MGNQSFISELTGLIVKGLANTFIGSVVKDSMDKVNSGIASEVDKQLVRAYYNKLSETRLVQINTEVKYHRQRIVELTSEKSKLLPPRQIKA